MPAKPSEATEGGDQKAGRLARRGSEQAGEDEQQPAEAQSDRSEQPYADGDQGDDCQSPDESGQRSLPV